MPDDSKALIVEDDRAVREGLRLLISGSDRYAYIASCDSAEDALKDIPKQQPQVVLVDISLPGMNAIECVIGIKNSWPQFR